MQCLGQCGPVQAGANEDSFPLYILSNKSDYFKLCFISMYAWGLV